MTRVCSIGLLLSALAFAAGGPPTDSPVLTISQFYSIDSMTGNGNGRWDPGEQVQLYVVLRNDGDSPASDVTGDLGTTDPLLSIQHGNSFFGSIGAGESTPCQTPYLATCQSSTPRGHWAVFALSVSCFETTFVAACSVQIALASNQDPIPDGPRTPALYWAFDDNDSGWAQRPVFNWVEVKDIGTRLTFAHNDQVKPIELPAWFGEFSFYGADYESLSVAADGWVACGFDTTRDYSNTPLPDTTGRPAMIALNWDDLYPFNDSPSGGVYYFGDSANHRFIVEYDSVAYYRPRSEMRKFELIVYDSTVSSGTGDNVLDAQYLDGIRDSSATVGIQDPTRTIGIQYVFNGVFNPLAESVTAGRVIRYVTLLPTGVAEAGSTPVVPRLLLNVNPNPSRAEFAISCDRALTGVVVYDASGRLVRRLGGSRSLAPSLPVSLRWDGRDQQGRRCSPGIYLISARSGGRVATQKAILLR